MSELRPLLTIESLDRELVDLLIDKVLVYGENEIEIVWLDEQYKDDGRLYVNKGFVT